MHADNWAQKAKSLGYRSRAVFKLIQITEKIKQIKNPNLILDIGAVSYTHLTLPTTPYV